MPQSSSAGWPLPLALWQTRDQFSGRLKCPETDIPTGIARTNTTPLLNERVAQHALATHALMCEVQREFGRVARSVDR